MSAGLRDISLIRVKPIPRKAVSVWNLRNHFPLRCPFEALYDRSEDMCAEEESTGASCANAFLLTPLGDITLCDLRGAHWISNYN